MSAAPLVSVRTVCLWTPRLLLREHTDRDAPAVSAYATDPASWFRAAADTPHTVADVQNNLARIGRQRDEQPTRKRYDLAIVRRDDEVLIGWLPLCRRGDDDAEIGWLVAPRYQRHGYTTEAAEAALRFAFEVLAVRRVCARCWRENRASMRVMEKLGMTPGGKATDEGEWVEGRWVPSILFHLSADQWRRTTNPVTYENE